MKWKKSSSEFLSEKTFLIIKDNLKSLEGNEENLDGKSDPNARGKSRSATNTGTWPPKVKKPILGENERPKTANLEKPSVLDPKLVNKLDMSLLSKELLMTRIRHKGVDRSNIMALTKRRRSVPIGDHQRRSISTAVAAATKNASTGVLLLVRQKRQSFEPLTDSELCNGELASGSPTGRRHSRSRLANALNSQQVKTNSRNQGNVSTRISAVSPEDRSAKTSSGSSSDGSTRKNLANSSRVNQGGLSLARRKCQSFEPRIEWEVCDPEIPSDRPLEKRRGSRLSLANVRDGSSRISVVNSQDESTRTSTGSSPDRSAKVIPGNSHGDLKKIHPVSSQDGSLCSPDCSISTVLTNLPDESKRTSLVNQDGNTRTSLGVQSLARQKRQSFEPPTDLESTIVDISLSRPIAKRRAKANPRMKANSINAKDRSMTHGSIGKNESPRTTSENSKDRSKMIPTSPPSGSIRRTPTNPRNGSTKRTNDPESRRLDDNNNGNKTSLTPAGEISSLTSLKRKNSKAAISSDVELFTSTVESAPEPCKTCGRPDQPERFHSHPKTALPRRVQEKETYKTTPKFAVPKTVQKPVALNFRSEKVKGKPEEESASGDRKPRSPETGSPLGESRTDNRTWTRRVSPGKRKPRTVVCYICGRQFGSTSFPIHEPKCLQKWERENNSLDPSQRRSLPRKPSIPLDHQDWNSVAWEQSQAQLVPCSKCGRTFLPDRHPVHERSCKATPKNSEGEKTERSETVGKSSWPVNVGPNTIPCQICGRNFGTRSIKIHEPQCIKRSNATRDTTFASRQEKGIFESEKSFAGSNGRSQKSSEKGIMQRKTLTCYICGRDFGSISITIHEPQCLKKWHLENEKLPPNQRRNEPRKPDLIYIWNSIEGTAAIDLDAMAEASWRSHLDQLVPCKRCGRTFNPDRVEIHERNCKSKR